MTKKYTDANLKIFALNSNRPLAEEIAEEVGVKLGKAEISTFEDGEISINIEESVRGDDVYLIQSTNDPSNDYIMEVLIMIDALRRASARSINVMMPYYGYARQDRKERPRESITAKVVANMLTVAGADRVMVMELHAPQIQGFFDIPVDHLSGVALLASHLSEQRLVDEQTVVISPDHAGVSRAREMAELLHLPLAIIDKRTSEGYRKEELRVIGEVKDYHCIIMDDLIDTGTTVADTAYALKQAGAKDIYTCVTHPVLSGDAVKKIEQSNIKKVIVTNTIYLPEEKRSRKIEQISAAPLLGEAIKRVHEQKSVKPLFDKEYVDGLMHHTLEENI